MFFINCPNFTYNNCNFNCFYPVNFMGGTSKKSPFSFLAVVKPFLAVVKLAIVCSSFLPQFQWIHESYLCKKNTCLATCVIFRYILITDILFMALILCMTNEQVLDKVHINRWSKQATRQVIIQQKLCKLNSFNSFLSTLINA